MRKTPLRRVSKKRAAQLKKYSVLRKNFLTNQMCGVCKIRPAGEIHHKNKRFGERLLDLEHFLAVCRGCHARIHLNPAWAHAKDYLVKQ